MKSQVLRTAAAAAALFATSFASQAGTIPYPTPGVENTELYTFTATASGTIDAYFFANAAAFTNELRMLVNGVDTGVQGLNNQTSVYGDMLSMGTVNAGDVIVFVMVNLAPGGIGPWYSDKSLNSDGVNHVYSTDFAGAGAVPGGTYVSFEDLPNGGDFNYTDLAFVFTNISTSTGVSAPPTLALLLAAGVAGLALRRRPH